MTFTKTTRTLTKAGASAEFPTVRVDGLPADVATRVTGDVNTQVTAMLDAFVEASADASPAAPAGSVFDLIEGTSAGWNRYLTVRLNESTNLGGAHPNNTSRTFVYDVRDGSAVEVPSLFTDQARMLGLIRQALIDQSPADRPLTADDVKQVSFAPLDTAKAPLSCGFAARGMRCVVDQGSVVAYALGPLEATLPWSTVLPQFKPGVATS